MTTTASAKSISETLRSMMNEVEVMAELVSVELKGATGSTVYYSEALPDFGTVNVTIGTRKLYGGVEVFTWKVEGETEEWDGIGDTYEVALGAACFAAVAHVFSDSSLS